MIVRRLTTLYQPYQQKTCRPRLSRVNKSWWLLACSPNPDTGFQFSMSLLLFHFNLNSICSLEIIHWVERKQKKWKKNLSTLFLYVKVWHKTEVLKEDVKVTVVNQSLTGFTWRFLLMEFPRFLNIHFTDYLILE